MRYSNQSIVEQLTLIEDYRAGPTIAGNDFWVGVKSIAYRSNRAAVLETVNRGQEYGLVGVIYPKVTFIFFVI